MQLRKATRQQSKLRLGLSATSGSGKTYSALLIAYGLVGDWDKIAVVDTENGSADLYEHLGSYNVIPLAAPFSPEKYIQAIKTCETAGIECIIIDSITHEWDGPGGILSISNSMSGNSYTNWAKITPRHDAFLQSILQSSAHIITTVRRKQDYEMSKDASGKTTVTKLGLKEVTRDGWEYEVTVNLELDTAHFATVSKDRTGLFSGKPSFVPDIETGKLLRDWCNSGAAPIEMPKPEPVVPGLEVLTLSHTNFGAVMDAVVNKGYTLDQVGTKYQIEGDAFDALKDAINAKNAPKIPEPVPVTQQQISEANANYAKPAAKAINGNKPF